ncbi:MAG TPA: hypothetical protein DCS51_07070, partial [Bacteroides sp.]|nr:hypothetical protein [Bacteroides sp.]
IESRRRLRTDRRLKGLLSVLFVVRQRVNRAEWSEGGVHECQKTYYKNLFKEPFSQEFVLSLQPNYIIKKNYD